MNGIVGSAVKLSLSDIPAKELIQLKEKLFFKRFQSANFVFSTKEEPKPVMFYTISNGSIVVPRRFGMEYAKARGIKLDDRRSLGDPVEIVFNEEVQAKNPGLKKKQDSVVEDVVSGLKSCEWNGGILQAGTGTGKTAMGIKIAVAFGLRSLFVVHTDFLRDQWRKELLKFTDLKEEDIGIIQQEKRDTVGKKVVIALIHTLIKRDFTPEERKAFGFVLFDECHHLPAEEFSKSLFKFDAKYLLGLSATPKRFDRLDVLLSLGIGARLNREAMAPQMTPTVYVVKHHTKIPERKYMRYVPDPRHPGERMKVANTGSLTVELIHIATRNRAISDYTLRAARAGRKVMVFSHRRRHLEGLQGEFDRIMERDRKADPSLPEKKSALFMGGISDEERDKAKDADVMYCTYQFAQEALDVPDRDCLIFATPASYVKQVVGRILRPMENKLQPIVIDILDWGIPKLERMATSRAKEYKALKATVKKPSGTAKTGT